MSGNHMTIKELREKQARLMTEARSRLDESRATGIDAARAAELEAQHDAAMAEYDATGAAITREERLAQAESEQRSREERARGDRRPGQDLEAGNPGGGSIDARSAFNLACRFGVSSLNAEQRAALGGSDLPVEMRAQLAGTDTAGGLLVPEGYSNEVARSMAAYGPMMQADFCRDLITDTGNNIPWPSIDDTDEGEAIDEDGPASDGDFVVGSKTLSAYLISSKAIKVSWVLMQDSAFNVESEIIAPIFGERLGKQGNKKLTIGTGSGQPNGIVTASGLGKTAASTTTFTANEIIDFYHSIDPAYRAMPKFKAMFHDDVLKALRKLVDGQGNYLIQNLGDQGSSFRIAGITVPYAVNQAMSAAFTTGQKLMVMGDFSKYIVRKVNGWGVVRLNERYADALQTGFVGFGRIDGNLVDAKAVKHLKLA
jgi:HK97 family phage major capsid protein